MPTLPLYRELGIEVLLRGHAGELMHMRKAYNYSLDREALAVADLAGLEAWLFGRLQAYLLEGLERPVFRGTFQHDAACLALDALREDLAETFDLGPPVQRVWQLFVTQRLRRETTLSLVKFRSVVETRLPYLDSKLVTLLLQAPPALKMDEQIQTHILRGRRPEFLRIANANTGARLGASSWARQLATLRMKALGRLGVPGYQPYERLGLWLRRELAPTVREILLSDECLERGLFAPDGVRRVVEAHVAGRRNHTFLLLALMIYELGQRYLCTETAEGT
jgi:hypothetical protein